MYSNIKFKIFLYPIFYGENLIYIFNKILILYNYTLHILSK